MAQFSIPLTRLAQKSGLSLSTVVRKATLDIFSRVVLRSPVDTGRFRANWNVSYGQPNASVTTDTGQGRIQAEIASVATSPVGSVSYLTNGLPYARRLEYGYSKQAPAGMVRLTVREFGAFVDKAIASLA